jgi:hypothetical protein
VPRTLTLAQLRALPDRLERAAKSSFIDQVRAAKDTARLEAARSVGGDLRMSGIGRSGARLGVRDSARIRKGAWYAKVWGTPAGAWSIITDGAATHSIDRRRRRRRRDRRGPAPLNVAGRPRVGPVRHPGMDGYRTWHRVKAKVETETPPRWAADVLAAVRSM